MGHFDQLGGLPSLNSYTRNPQINSSFQEMETFSPRWDEGSSGGDHSCHFYDLYIGDFQDRDIEAQSFDRSHFFDTRCFLHFQKVTCLNEQVVCSCFPRSVGISPFL